MKKARVLEIIGKRPVGGVGTVMLNYQTYIDAEKIQMDYLIFGEEPENFDEQIKALGSKVYMYPALSGSQMGKTKQYLCSVMKKYAGTTPTAYINDLRLGYIASMLESSKTPISELCFEAGFYSESYFEKLFKEKYKITPGEYRKMLT